MDTYKYVKPPLGMNKIQDVMKPVLVSLELFGLFYNETDNKVGAVEESKDGRRCDGEKKKHGNKFRKIYCWSVLCCLTVSALRYIPGFWIGASFVPGFTVQKVINASWYLQCVLSTGVILFNCRNGTWNSFFKLWNNALQATHSVGLGNLENNLRRFTVICNLCAWGVWIFNVIGVFLMVCILNTDFINSFTNPLPDNSACRGILLVMHLYFSAIWVFCIPFVLVCCKSIADAFYLHSKTLKCAIKTNTTKLTANLEQLRRQHLKLCQYVHIIDRPMGIILMNLVTIYIFLACFILYQLVNTSNNLVNTIMMVMWVLTSYLSIGFVSWFASTVNDAAHSPLEYIYDISTDGLTTEQLGQLTLFLSKLTGTSIGFTAMGFFTITKEVILTIGGLYLTYFFLLLQFKIS